MKGKDINKKKMTYPVVKKALLCFVVIILSGAHITQGVERMKFLLMGGEDYKI